MYSRPVRSIPAAVSLAVLTGATAAVLQLSAGPAAADSATLLPTTSVGDLVVDRAHQRIFLSDPVGGRLFTTDLAGKVLATADGLPGINDLLLSDRLYAVMPAAGAIVTFDPATSARTATYDTGGRPETLTAAAGKIWFGEDRQGLGSLDLSGPEPVIIHRPDVPNADGPFPDVFDLWGDAPVIATSPSNPNLLAALELGSSSGAAALFDVSTDPPTLVAHRAFDGGMGLAFSPDGSRLIVTARQRVITALSTRDLSTIENYQATDWAPGAPAVRDDGTIAVRGNTAGYQGAVALYTPGTAAPIKQLDLHPALDAAGKPIALDLTSVGSSLVWSPGGKRLFTVAVKISGLASHPDPILSLQVLNEPVTQPVSLVIQPPGKIEIGQPYTVTGSVSPAPAGSPLMITRSDPSAPDGRRVGPETVPASGSFAFQDVQTVAGRVTYTISYPGEEGYAAATSSGWGYAGTTGPTTLTLDRNGSTWAYGSTVTVTAKLGTTYLERWVRIYADPAGSDQPKRLIAEGAVDSRGARTASFKLNRDTTITAVYLGDEFSPSKSVTSTVYTRASVTTAVAKQYKTAKIGSVPYYYFHKAKNPVFTTTINPYPGRKQYLQIDVWKGGKWVAWSKGYYALNSAGKSVRVLTGKHSVGLRYRVRAAYLDGKSGDTANATAYGPYRYFTFTK
jgi:hypothetical protein